MPRHSINKEGKMDKKEIIKIVDGLLTNAAGNDYDIEIVLNFDETVELTIYPRKQE